MRTNADITIYNSVLNPETRLKEWRRTLVRGAWFYADHKVNLAEGGLVSANIFKIRIPDQADSSGSRYVPPEEYHGDEGTWTLKADDYIVRGISNAEIEKPADLQTGSGQVARITSWSDNRFGSMKHWRVGGE